MNEYLGALVAKFRQRKKEPVDMERSNQENYLDLKRKTEEEAAEHGLTVKVALLAGYPLEHLCRKHLSMFRHSSPLTHTQVYHDVYTVSQ